MSDVFEQFAAFLLVILLFIPLALYSGWILSVMWGWFIVPLGLRDLSLSEAAGVMYIWIWLKPKTSSKVDPSISDVFTRVGAAIITGLFVLALGWVLAQFIA